MGRKIAELRPCVAQMALAALTECTAKGIGTLVTCTSRTNAEQSALYAQGRTTPGLIVTKAKPGQSLHQYGVALDVYPVVNGKPDFSGKAPEWHTMAAIFKKHGFEWAYDWKRFKEMPHFQYTGGHSLAYFQAGGTI